LPDITSFAGLSNEVTPWWRCGAQNCGLYCSYTHMTDECIVEWRGVAYFGSGFNPKIFKLTPAPKLYSNTPLRNVAMLKKICRYKQLSHRYAVKTNYSSLCWLLTAKAKQTR